ncbi:type II toxin-antitoxin system RnlB family antitoxin [Bacillus fungorum]|uniref:type II toxin-antitoxin system RnlB family antitoxin n=1 Tax=Bacillus fungorum TaxID=2039284 RepID=UPI003F579464
MKTYELINFQSDGRKVVLSTSYVSPLSKVFLIANELAQQGYSGEVLFDLLLSNGFTNNRFLKMRFDGNKILPNTSEILSELSTDLLKEIYDFYHGHPEYVDKSSLPDTQKYLLKNNLITNNLLSS